MEEYRVLPAAEKEEIKGRVREALQRLPEVLFAYLHGSFLEAPAFRDLDVALYVDEEQVPRDGVISYELEKAASLDRTAGCPVDVKVLNYAPPPFRYHATRGELLFSRDEEARYTMLESTWREYFDYQPLARQFLRDILQGQGEREGIRPAGSEDSPH